jgi:hypothetical protein
MQVLGKGRCLYVDVDNTLIRPAAFGPEVLLLGSTHYTVLGHNVETLKRFSDNPGTTIFVWSLGGAEWAEKVVRALKLQDYVDFCISKPTWFLDDRRDAGFTLNDEAWIDANGAA